jgi:putative hydrolase of the HAD superfamily
MHDRRFTILLDCGDTIVDEGTEVKDSRGASLRAELIPGADLMVRGLVGRGYRIGLVADGPADTFRNVLTQHGLYDLFHVRAISEEVGVSKPDARMFTAALDPLGVRPDAYDRVVMVGNNLERDIRGANLLGIVSVFLRWSTRRSWTPVDETEIPAHTIERPVELLELMDRLEDEYESRIAATSGDRA